MRVFKGISALILLIFSLQSSAYVIAQSGGDRATHIFVIGNAGDLGNLFLRAAQSKILKYKELYPQDKIVLIGAKEYYKKQSFIRSYFKHQIVKANRKTLTPNRLAKAIRLFSNIDSIDFFSHSGAVYGIALDKNTPLTYEHSDFFTSIKSHLNKNAHIAINGCNSGFIQAPHMSKLLGIPVFGSLTSTDFQNLHSNGNWYNNNRGNYPEGGWASTNNISYSTPISCYKNGGCTRMKPDNHQYRGHWGAYYVGLPYYRPFCAKNVSEKNCQRAMVKEVLLYPSHYIAKQPLTKNEFTELLIDYMCPQNKNGTIRQHCQEILLSNSVDTPLHTIFHGTYLECDRTTCHFAVKGSGRKASFRPLKTYDPEFDQMIYDFNEFLRAYDALY